MYIHRDTMRARGDLMAQTMISIRIDENLKREMDDICQELGLNMTTAFTIFAKQMVRERKIPFEVSATTSKEEMSAMTIDDQMSIVANELADELGAEFVQAIGRKFTLYRESKDNKQIELPRK